MNIYVGNLAGQTTEENLNEAFGAFGTIASVRIIKDGTTGESKGFGFVVMEDEDQAKAAIEEMNGKELDGNALKVEQGHARKEPSRGFDKRRGDSRGGYSGRGRRDSRGGRGGGGRRDGRGQGRGRDRGSSQSSSEGGRRY